MHRACHMIVSHQSRHSVIRASQAIHDRAWLLMSLSTKKETCGQVLCLRMIGDFDSISLEKDGHLPQSLTAQSKAEKTLAAFLHAICMSLQAVLAGLQVVDFLYSLCARSWVCDSSHASHGHSDTARCAGSTAALPHGSSNIKLHIRMC